MHKNIAFYISDQGTEHALRNIHIINTILKMEDDLSLHIKTGKMQASLMRTYIKPDERLHFYEMEMSDQLVDQWDERMENEISFLKAEEIGLLVSDICPWILLAADELRIKSLLIGHYTWADMYDGQEELQDAYLECYETASQMLIYDLHHPAMTTYGVKYELVSMICRPYNIEEIEKIKSSYGKPLLLLDAVLKDSSEKVDVNELPYHFLAMEGMNVKGDNVTYLSPETKNMQNYVAASRYVISDATWNRVAEILLSNTKSALIGKENVPMGKEIISILKEREQCIEIRHEDLSDMKGILEKLEAFSYSFEHEYHNNDYEIGRKILFAYPEKRRRNRA